MLDKNTRLAYELATVSDAFGDDEDSVTVIRAMLKATLDDLKSISGQRGCRYAQPYIILLRKQ